MTNILVIIVDAAKDNSYSWLIAASLPPALYFLTRKRRQSWLQKLMVKWVMKRVVRRAKKGKSSSDASVYGWILGLSIIGLILSLIIKSSGLGIISLIFGLLALMLNMMEKQGYSN